MRKQPRTFSSVAVCSRTHPVMCRMQRNQTVKTWTLGGPLENITLGEKITEFSQYVVNFSILQLKVYKDKPVCRKRARKLSNRLQGVAALWSMAVVSFFFSCIKKLNWVEDFVVVIVADFLHLGRQLTDGRVGAVSAAGLSSSRQQPSMSAQKERLGDLCGPRAQKSFPACSLSIHLSFKKSEKYLALGKKVEAVLCSVS